MVRTGHAGFLTLQFHGWGKRTLAELGVMCAPLPLPLGEVPPQGGGEGPLSHGLGRDSSPKGGAKKSLNTPFPQKNS